MMQKKRARLLTIVMAVALGVLLIATQFDQQVHYVNPGTLNHHFFWRRGWYYDGTDWAYVRGGRKVTGSQKINGVQYHLAIRVDKQSGQQPAGNAKVYHFT